MPKGFAEQSAMNFRFTEWEMILQDFNTIPSLKFYLKFVVNHYS